MTGDKRTGQDKAVEIRNLTKKYGNLTAVDGLSLEVPKEKIFGLLGPNGAGKTTTIKMLLGLSSPTSGSAKVLGVDPEEDRPKMMEKIGYMPESPNYPGDFSALELMKLYGALYIGGGSEGKTVEELLKLVNLWTRKEEKIENFSKGMLRRFSLAQALVGNPKLVVLDEPITGLDPEGVKETRDYIQSLPERGTSVLMSSHILAEVEKLCDHVCILKNGLKVIEGEKDRITDGSTTLEDFYIESVRGNREDRER